MSEDNTFIWDSAKKTDPAFTKKNTQGGYTSTTVSGYWFIKKATELWGAMGSEWGYTILEDKFDDGAPIFDKETGIVICKSMMHTMKIRLWYPNCKEGGVVQVGHTPYIYGSKHGAITDMEAPKKSLTDALKKALSMLGFAFDIYSGEFDDINYVEERRNEEALEKADNKIEEKAKQEEEYRKWFDDHLQLLATSTSMNELEKLFKLMFRKINLRKDEKAIKIITRTKNTRKEQLEKENDTA